MLFLPQLIEINNYLSYNIWIKFIYLFCVNEEKAKKKNLSA